MESKLLAVGALLLLLAAPVHAEDGPALHLALGAYMTLNGVDLAQTMHCAGAGQCMEANPFMRPFVDHPAAFGAIKIGLDTAAVYGILKLYPTHPRLAWALAAFGIALESYAVGHNAREVR